MRYFRLRFSVRFLRHRRGYGLRRMCLHYIRLSCDFCMKYLGTDRDKIVRRLHGDCTDIVRSQCCHRTVSVRFSFGKRLTKNCTIAARSSRGRRAGIVQCPYDMSTGYGLTIFNSLYNFLLYKIVEAAAPVNPYDIVRLWPPPYGGRTIMELRAVYGLRRYSVGQI